MKMIKNLYHFVGVKTKRIETKEQKKKRIQNEFLKDYAKWMQTKAIAEERKNPKRKFPKGQNPVSNNFYKMVKYEN